MQHLGTLTGTGNARLGEEYIGSVRYTINVSVSQQIKAGYGTIEAANAVLHKIMNAGVAATIDVEDGGTVDVLITKWDVTSGRAEVSTN